MQNNISYTAKNKGDFTLNQRDVRINFDLDAGDEAFNKTRHVLKNGEYEGAVVISVFPLYVAAYSKEMDAVILLNFSDKKMESLNQGLFVKSRLLTVNGYETDNKLKKSKQIQKDLIPTKNTTYKWQKVYPVIADFVVVEKDRLEQIKREFTEEYWDHIYDMGSTYFKYNKRVSRSGMPNRSGDAFLSVDVEAYYKKTYGDSYKESMPLHLRKKKNKTFLIAIYLVSITIYLLLLQFTDEDEATIFKVLFEIFF